MTMRMTYRIFVSLLFVCLIVAVASAQTAVHNGSPNQAQAAKKAAAENNPACQQIVNECKKLGYIVGEWKKDNGLWKDCFDPVLRGQQPTRDGKSENVPVSAGTVQECRQAVNHK
jgi:hypothetical protein